MRAIDLHRPDKFPLRIAPLVFAATVSFVLSRQTSRKLARNVININSNREEKQLIGDNKLRRRWGSRENNAIDSRFHFPIARLRSLSSPDSVVVVVGTFIVEFTLLSLRLSIRQTRPIIWQTLGTRFPASLKYSLPLTMVHYLWLMAVRFFRQRSPRWRSLHARGRCS